MLDEEYRSSSPLPKIADTQMGVCYFYFVAVRDSNPSKCNSPVDCCWPGRAPATPYNSSHREELATNPIIHLIKNTWLDTISSQVLLFYVGMMPGTGCCSNFFVVLISVGI